MRIHKFEHWPPGQTKIGITLCGTGHYPARVRFSKDWKHVNCPKCQKIARETLDAARKLGQEPKKEGG